MACHEARGCRARGWALGASFLLLGLVSERSAAAGELPVYDLKLSSVPGGKSVGTCTAELTAAGWKYLVVKEVAEAAAKNTKVVGQHPEPDPVKITEGQMIHLLVDPPGDDVAPPAPCTCFWWKWLALLEGIVLVVALILLGRRPRSP